MAKKILALNPWLSVTKLKHVATCDEQYFVKLRGSVADYEWWVNYKYPAAELTFSCLPEPFSGSPNSKVFCLNKNPGRPDPCFRHESAFDNATLLNLQLKSLTCFWVETIPNKCGKLHDGVQWLAKRTRELETILGRHPNIFFVEYFPYHSTQGFPFTNNLPSYDFSNKLVEQAMHDNKMIIIMRERANWLKRIPALVGYKYLVYLKSSQSGYLSLGNLIWANSGTKLSNKDVCTFFYT